MICGINTHHSVIRRRNNGVWEKLLATLIDEPEFTWLMIDESQSKVLPHASGAKGDTPAPGRTKEGSTQNCT